MAITKQPDKGLCLIIDYKKMRLYAFLQRFSLYGKLFIVIIDKT